jgi:hypothetical protein
MPQSWISDRSAALKSALTGIGATLAYLTTTFEGANKALASIEKLGIPKDVAVLTVVVTLGVASAYFLLQSISKRSKLLRPERFRLETRRYSTSPASAIATRSCFSRGSLDRARARWSPRALSRG